MGTHAALLLGLALSCTSCGGPGAASGYASGNDAAGDDSPPFPVHLTPRQAKGRMIFDEACAPCHVRGSRRDDPGASGPEPDLADKAYGRLTPAQLAARFDGGHGSDLGSVFGPEDIRAILSYLPDLSYPSDAPGSAVSGRKIYRRYCSSCHGLKGDGNGPAVALLNTVPSAFTRDTLVGARDFAALARVIREGPGHPHVSSMPAWGLFFDQRMLDDVAAYLPTFQAGGSGATRSPPPSSGSPPA